MFTELPLLNAAAVGSAVFALPYQQHVRWSFSPLDFLPQSFCMPFAIFFLRYKLLNSFFRFHGKTNSPQSSHFFVTVTKPCFTCPDHEPLIKIEPTRINGADTISAKGSMTIRIRAPTIVLAMNSRMSPIIAFTSHNSFSSITERPEMKMGL
jgi:hypothetical protein